MTRSNARRYKSEAFLSEPLKILAVALVALQAGACSYSFGGIGLEVLEPATTGSIAPTAETDAEATLSPSPLSPALNEEDWRRARAALAVALDPQGPGTQVSWDNPDSGMAGTFTPTGAPYVENDEICRAFSALLSGPAAASLHGTACRPSGGEWRIGKVGPAVAQTQPEKAKGKAKL